MTLLVTAFEAFDSHLNSSQEVLTALRKKHPSTFMAQTIHYETLPCDHQPLPAIITQLFQDIKPQTCLLMGQASKQAQILLERFALNILDFRIPDNAKAQPQDKPVIDGGPHAYRTSLTSMHKLTTEMNNQGIPVTTSNHAGTYLCNQAYYLALHHITSMKNAIPCIFMHIPLLPEQCIDDYHGAPHLTLDTSVHAAIRTLKHSMQHTT